MNQNLDPRGDVDIEFIGSGLKKNTKVDNIKNDLPNPFAKSCIAFEKPEYEVEGYYNDSKSDSIYQILKMIILLLKWCHHQL